MTKRIAITFEYILKSSPHILFEFIGEPAELGQWFADKVTEDKQVYTFIWDDYPQKARLAEWHDNHKVRFNWEDNDEYLIFEIEVTNITKETVLKVTDFCDEKGEKDLKLLWDTSLKKLMQRIGGS